MLLAGQSANWLDTVSNIELGTFTEMKEDGYSFLSRKYSPLPQSSLVYMYLTAEHDNPWWSLCMEWVCLSLHRVNSNSSVNTQVSCCSFKLVLTFNLYWGLMYLALFLCLSCCDVIFHLLSTCKNGKSEKIGILFVLFICYILRMWKSSWHKGST